VTGRKGYTRSSCSHALLRRMNPRQEVRVMRTRKGCSATEASGGRKCNGLIRGGSLQERLAC
jgi:hypothetical protein